MEGPGRYRRAFDWRLNTADRDDTTTAAGPLVALFSSEMPELLEDYLQISRKRRNNRLVLARLQAHLVDELITVEATVSHYRNNRAQLEQGEDHNQDASQQDTTKNDLNFVRKELFLWRAFANVIRSIADGHVPMVPRPSRAEVLCLMRGGARLPGVHHKTIKRIRL